MLIIILRTLIIYTLVLLSMRIMGKRQIGELQLSELVITLILSEVAVVPIVDVDFPLTHALVPIALLLSLELLISFIVTKNSKLKLIFDGRPSVIIAKGKVDRKEMMRLRITLDELLSELRQKDIHDIRDVDYAILEHNGKLSVSLRSGARGVTTDDLGLHIREVGIAHTMVVDGNICEYNLKLTGHDKNWISGVAAAQGAALKDIFLLTLNDAGEVNIILRDEK